jgi:hypothetical protein
VVLLLQPPRKIKLELVRCPGGGLKVVCILVYGSDKLLLETRSMVLENAGFRVFPAIQSREAEIIIDTQHIALVVLWDSGRERSDGVFVLFGSLV